MLVVERARWRHIADAARERERAGSGSVCVWERVESVRTGYKHFPTTPKRRLQKLALVLWEDLFSSQLIIVFKKILKTKLSCFSELAEKAFGSKQETQQLALFKDALLVTLPFSPSLCVPCSLVGFSFSHSESQKTVAYKAAAAKKKAIAVLRHNGTSAICKCNGDCNRSCNRSCNCSCNRSCDCNCHCHCNHVTCVKNRAICSWAPVRNGRCNCISSWRNRLTVKRHQYVKAIKTPIWVEKCQAVGAPKNNGFLTYWINL